MRNISIAVLMWSSFLAGIFFVYSCSSGSSSSAATIGELETRIAALESAALPVYDSGWVDIAADSELTFNHNLDVHPDNLVIDIQQWSSLVGIPNYISNVATGSDPDSLQGVYWRVIAPSGVANADTNSIIVYRAASDVYAEKIRVRIWNRST